MKDSKFFVIVPNDDKLRHVQVRVIEHLPYDPAAYQHESGWMVADWINEYFISEGGRVDKAFKNEDDVIAWAMGWGECPEVIERWKMLLSQEGS